MEDEKEYTKGDFISIAKNECRVIGEMTGYYFFVEQVNDGPNYNIWKGKDQVIQSSNYAYLLGFLRGMSKVFQEEWY